MMITVQLFPYQKIYIYIALISSSMRCARLQRMHLEINVYFKFVLISVLYSITQDISLYVEFTIRETFLYFGWVNGMKTEEIDEKLHFLLKFLQLPSANRFVKNLRLEPSVLCQQCGICGFVP
jgi:ABC-type Na+ transport system ATPase subunit NatA